LFGGLKALVQSIEVGQLAGVEIALDRLSALCLAGAVMCERKRATIGRLMDG
jgi:hypothetical protein